MKVLILAAGYGTRLYPLTKKVAKPLLCINNKPIINFLIDKIICLGRKYPIDEIRVVANNKFYQDFVSWKDKYKIEVTILNDGSSSPDDRLGAIKDMEFGIQENKSDWLIAGGDNLFQDDLLGFMDLAVSKAPYPTVGVYDLGSKSEASRCGVVEINKENRIIRFKEKPKDPFSTLVASCVYYLPEGSLDLMNLFIEANENVDAAGKYIEWLINQTNVFAYKLKGKWMDIGHVDSLKLAEEEFSVS